MGIFDSVKNLFVEEVEESVDSNDSYTKDYQDNNTYSNQNADYCLFVEKPSKYEDAQGLANKLKSGNVLIVSLANLPKQDIRRLIDFLSGVVLARNGMIKKISQDTLILTPANVKMITDK